MLKTFEVALVERPMSNNELRSYSTKSFINKVRNLISRN